MKAAVHSFETAGTLDGPGIRFVLFLHGCPLRCLFCHNPDTWAAGAQKFMSAGEILTEIKKYSAFFSASGGGVPVSGGEPLMQQDFMIEFLGLLKKNSIHSAVDTCGYADLDAGAEEIIKLADMFLFDVKHADPAGHLALTGKSSEKPRKFLERICERGKRVWIRCVLVNGVTASAEYAEKLGEYLKPFGDKIGRVELLPYHTLGAAKWERLGLDYGLKGVEPTSPETAAEFRKALAGILPETEIV